LPLRQLDLPAATELAETLLIVADLRNSLDSLSLWSRNYVPIAGASPDLRVILGSLFRDGVVQFVGCFEKSSHPLKVPEVYKDQTGADGYFKWLRDLRNSFAAHRYGAGRQCIVGALVDPEKGYIGHGHIVSIYTGPEPNGHIDLLRFVGVAIAFAEAKVQKLQSQFDGEVSAIPLADLLKAPLAQVYGMEPAEMGLSRGDLQKARNGPPKS
jgi:hypothetical protein